MKDEGFEHAHTSPIKTPGQLMMVVALAFVIPVVGIILLASWVSSGSRSDPRKLDPEAVAQRIQPVARVVIGGAAPGGAPAAPKSGEEVYKTVCTTCHAQGVAGAHKFGDKAAWAPHLGEGLEALAKNAINGIRGMPARGGNPSLSDLEVTRAVVYMANAAGANFKEPAAPVAAVASKPAAARTGEQIVQTACGNCHLTGETGAPKIGDKAAWSKRVSRGIDSVVASAIKGHGGMPARGGFADLTDPEMKEAVLFMMSAAGGKVTSAAPVAPTSAAAAPAGDDKGKGIYNQACVACHATGVAGAPKFGDKGAWAPRIATGIDALYASSIKGKGAMPAKGGNSTLADADVKAAVDFMVAAAK